MDATLSDAVRDYLVGQCLVPEEQITGLVWDGEVYTVNPRVVFGVCTRPRLHGDYGMGHRPTGTYDTKVAAEKDSDRIRDLDDACGEVISRIVAESEWGKAR